MGKTTNTPRPKFLLPPKTEDEFRRLEGMGVRLRDNDFNQVAQTVQTSNSNVSLSPQVKRGIVSRIGLDGTRNLH